MENDPKNIPTTIGFGGQVLPLKPRVGEEIEMQVHITEDLLELHRRPDYDPKTCPCPICSTIMRLTGNSDDEGR